MNDSSLFTNDGAVIDSFFYMPSRAGRVTMEEIERRNRELVRLTWGVPNMDDYLIPMMPGDLISILARPGHCKTLSMIHLARQANQQLVDFGATNRLVVYATWETLIEEFVTVNISVQSGYSLEHVGRGEVKLDRISSAIAKTINQRTAIFGKSMVSPKGVHTLDDLETALSWMVDEGMPPALLLVDYLQRLPSGFGQDRSGKVSENHERLKDFALNFRMPVVVGVQAKRDVDDYKGLKLPQMDDGQWTSVIEQTSDKIISGTRPIRYMEPGSTVAAGDTTYEVDELTMVYQVVKQRYGRAGQIFVVNLDPPSSTISEREPLSEVF